MKDNEEILQPSDAVEETKEEPSQATESAVSRSSTLENNRLVSNSTIPNQRVSDVSNGNDTIAVPNRNDDDNGTLMTTDPSDPILVDDQNQPSSNGCNRIDHDLFLNTQEMTGRCEPSFQNNGVGRIDAVDHNRNENVTHGDDNEIIYDNSMLKNDHSINANDNNTTTNQNDNTRVQTGEPVLYDISIPEGVSPGDEFPVLAGCRFLLVRCPETHRPGQVLTIEVPPEPLRQLHSEPCGRARAGESDISRVNVYRLSRKQNKK